MDWEQSLWAEIERLSPEERIVLAGEVIVQITRNLLPSLGDVRREAVLEILERPEWDARRLAETIGSRSSTITRLAEEGRRRRRERDSEAGSAAR